ncbi:TRAF3-interacting protein 1-like isoform X3 [Arapaima gigas]
MEEGALNEVVRGSSGASGIFYPLNLPRDESDSDGGAECHLEGKADQLENGDMVDSRRTQTTLSSNRRLPRPSSARPAPPRMKRQESNTEGASAERLGSTKPLSVVIVDGRKLYQEEDDDEQFVVEEAAPLPPAMSELEAVSGLVKKILETKKDFETSSSSAKSKDQERILVSQLSWKKERDLVSREMERLRTSVQTVCRSALPLGKIIDYIQEDVDSMQAELQAWRHENREHAQSLLEEQRITDNAVEPLKAELAQLEQLIQEQQDKICAINLSQTHLMVLKCGFGGEPLTHPKSFEENTSDHESSVFVVRCAGRRGFCCNAKRVVDVTHGMETTARLGLKLVLSDRVL